MSATRSLCRAITAIKQLIIVPAVFCARQRHSAHPSSSSIKEIPPPFVGPDPLHESCPVCFIGIIHGNLGNVEAEMWTAVAACVNSEKEFCATEEDTCLHVGLGGRYLSRRDVQVGTGEEPTLVAHGHQVG